MPTDFSSMATPLATGPATKMLAAGLEKLREKEGLTQREVAHRLGYKTSVVVSHMATGRVPVPVERVSDIAEVLQLDPKRFLLAVLEQRFPSANIRELLGIQMVSRGQVASRLELLAGADLDDLSGETRSMLDEVVTAVDPRRRWLSLEELALVELLRRRFPELKKRSLAEVELLRLEHCLGAVAALADENGGAPEDPIIKNPEWGTF